MSIVSPEETSGFELLELTAVAPCQVPSAETLEVFLGSDGKVGGQVCALRHSYLVGEMDEGPNLTSASDVLEV